MVVAIHEAPTDQELAIAAGLGAQGQHPGNIERDLHIRMAKLLDVPFKVLELEVPRITRRTGESRQSTAAMVCPHEVFGLLSENPEKSRQILGDPTDGKDF